MNIGFGCDRQPSSETAASIAELVEQAGMVWTGPEGFYDEFKHPMQRTFEALGCLHVFALSEAGSPHAPRPEDARHLLRALAELLVDNGATHVAVVFAAEFDEDPRYQSGSPADFDRLIANGWADNRMRLGHRGGARPFYIQEYNEVPWVFEFTPPSA